MGIRAKVGPDNLTRRDRSDADLEARTTSALEADRPSRQAERLPYNSHDTALN